MPPIRFRFWQENSLKSVSLTEEVTYLSSHRRGQVSWIKLRSLKCFSLAELCPPALHFMENFLGPPLDQSRRNVLWPLMRQMYLTVNSWAPAPAECLRTVEDRLQSCQAQILQRLVPFPLHGQTRMQINHLTELVISLMGFHPWLCRLSPPHPQRGRGEGPSVYRQRKYPSRGQIETSFKPSWSHHRSKTARANWSSQLVTG